MPAFKLKSGNHYQGGQRFVPGDVVELTAQEYAAFSDKFEPVSQQEATQPVKSGSEKPESPQPPEFYAELEAFGEAEAPEPAQEPEANETEAEPAVQMDPAAAAKHTVAEILAFVDEGVLDPEAMLVHEQAASKPRKSLVEGLETVLATE